MLNETRWNNLIAKLGDAPEGENHFRGIAAAMQKGKIVNLTTSIAMNASKLSLQYRLPMAGSIILSTAQMYECVTWTQDSDFENLPGVKYFPRTKVGQ